MSDQEETILDKETENVDFTKQPEEGQREILKEQEQFLGYLTLALVCICILSLVVIKYNTRGTILWNIKCVRLLFRQQ